MTDRTYHAGDSLEDYCRACHTDRMHVVVAADAEGRPLRVVCGFCRSEHNYRGGPRIAAGGPAAPARERTREPAREVTRTTRPAGRDPFPLVSERERTAPAMSDARRSPCRTAR